MTGDKDLADQVIAAIKANSAPDTQDRGKVRLCAVTPPGDAQTAPDLLAALELLLPFAVTAPKWAIEWAQEVIKQAKATR